MSLEYMNIAILGNRLKSTGEMTARVHCKKLLLIDVTTRQLDFMLSLFIEDLKSIFWCQMRDRLAQLRYVLKKCSY